MLLHSGHLVIVRKRPAVLRWWGCNASGGRSWPGVSPGSPVFSIRSCERFVCLFPFSFLNVSYSFLARFRAFCVRSFPERLPSFPGHHSIIRVFRFRPANLIILVPFPSPHMPLRWFAPPPRTTRADSEGCIFFTLRRCKGYNSTYDAMYMRI